MSSQGIIRSREPQIRFLSRRHRCIVYAARGYPPSDAPTNPTAEHSSIGSALTMRGVQSKRPSLYDLTENLAAALRRASE